MNPRCQLAECSRIECGELEGTSQRTTSKTTLRIVKCLLIVTIRGSNIGPDLIFRRGREIGAALT